MTSPLLKLTAGALLSLASITAFAQAQPAPAPAPVPVPPTKMQAAVGGSVVQYLQARGFAANDPRVYRTLYLVGKASTSTAVVVAGGAVAGAAVAGTAPAWASVLAVAAVSAGLSYAIPLAIDGTVQWIFGPGANPVVVVSPSGNTTAIYYPAPVNGQTPTCEMASNVYNHCAKAGQQAFFSACLSSGQPNPTLSCSSDASLSFDDAMKRSGMVPKAPPSTVESAPQTMEQAVASLTPAQKAQPLDPKAIAATADLVLRTAAAQPGYDGIPVPAGQVAITPQHVPTLEAAPTVADFVAPTSPTLENYAPSSSPASSSSTTPGSSPGPVASTPTAPDAIASPEGSSKVDLGPDPAVGAPTLEAIPTGEMILGPIMALMPSLKSFQMPEHSAECPRPAFEIFGQSLVLSTHCELIESQRSTIHVAALAAFALMSVIIVLRA